MPPKKGIVKSGAAFTSKDKNTSLSAASTSTTPPALFHPGSKYPFSILQERCQKLGWDKATVDTHSHGPNKFTFMVTLSRWNQKKSEREIVRMEPHPPYFRPSAIEAKHWGATYALYRFSNGLSLNRVLPTGPREYWMELAEEHKNIPEHQKWMYYADPFGAKKEVEERQAQSAKKKEEASGSTENAARNGYKGSGTLTSDYPEVIMATSLRELVEEAIKEASEANPDGQDGIALTLAPESIPNVTQQLGHLGFTKPQIQDAIKFLSEDSTLTWNLLSTQTPLQACIEYLILHVPECDLPKQFLPVNNSSNPFITSAHSGEDDLKRRWIEDKAVKEAGWPLQAVKECTAKPEVLRCWDLLLVILGRKLIGLSGVDFDANGDDPPYSIQSVEYEALGAHLAEPGHLVVPLFSAPIEIHVLFSESKRFPRPGYYPVYITSTTAPAYVRLHLLSRLLLGMQASPHLEAGEGFCMAVMRIVEEAWAEIEDNGPPDIASVMKNIIPRPPKQVLTVDDTLMNIASNDPSKPKGSRRLNTKTDDQIKQEFEALQQTKKYQQILEKRQKLPAFQAREDFLEKLEKNRVVVVVGETGCGKTTQLPQFILDSMIACGRGSKASILVTQPRRISAISVSARVSEERGEDGSVGYTIRGETKRERDTKLLFCTTGVVLRRLSTGDDLNDVSHIIVDEVHERSMDGDFLLLELKELLKTHPTLKVVLMSATINHETFVRYFDDAPLMTIPGFTHPVTDKYLEDVLSVINYRPPAPKTYGKPKTAAGKRHIREEYQAEGYADPIANAIQNLIRSDRIDYQLIASLVDHIVSTTEVKGGILIFLPGVNEIRQCIDAIRQTITEKSASVFPLHANLSNEEQRRVFQKTKSWKIIAATNVAETSITIDDVVYVIDAGKVKETQYDPETSLSMLVETWVTRAAARQRRGRAGRTQPGVCYKLYTKKQEEQMTKFPVPEILRVPLENISLSVKAAREDQDVKCFLRQTIDPPSIAALDNAWNTLKELNAVDDSGNLTSLGRYMAMLPVDVRLAKMLVLGIVFQCLGPITTVAALLSSKPIFNNPLEKREEANAARARFATGDSDILTDVKAYDECTKMREAGQSQSAIRSFCEGNFINANLLREITSLRQDFVSSLAEIGLVPFNATPSSPELNHSAENINLIKAAMLGGLWPRIVRVDLPEKNIKYDKVSAGTVRRENIATDYKMFDLKEGRVFLHPGSVLFGTSNWKPPFLFYFHKHMSSKVFLRDATKVPVYAILLFGGSVSVNDHVRGGLTVGTKDNYIKFRAIPRIGVLVNHLRRLLDAQLKKSIEDGTMLTVGSGNPIVHAIMALLTHDGKTEQI
ncbi:P-loop containing nucleoside triphosphate hydrolase protein [Pholiota conissans]|uniref:RNA helicase n=1 Tax=Pholiota conissans TaxID=109636 RepID=A0A9P6D0L5_9AGAR|nr:P-loop containing nucleoside triphosphate hydrolase protein [Pholiota conissans]